MPEPTLAEMDRHWHGKNAGIEVKAVLKINLVTLTILLAFIIPAAAQTGENAANQDSVKYPPWRLGEMKNPATVKGEEFTIPEANIVSDLHGNPKDAQLIIYSFGHYYFLLGELVRTFMDKYPETRGKVFYETLPLGVVSGQLRKNGTLTMGNLTISIQPDVFMGGRAAVTDLIDEGLLVGPDTPYMTTRLGIMVRKGNPKNITGLQDLDRPGLRLAMPNPEHSGTAQRGVEIMQEVGGDELVDAVYETKVNNGETRIVRLHHRETPIALMKGEVDAGLTWVTEAIYQEMVGNPIGYVTIPEEQNVTGVFTAAMVKNAPHPDIAEAWLQHLTSPEARQLIEKYRFGVYTEDEDSEPE